MSTALFLGYAGCSTCTKAKKWLAAQGHAIVDRAIVDAPPTVSELLAWVPASGVPLRKWLNTSGQSYRALGKATVDGWTDQELLEHLAADGKLVKRPVLVLGDVISPRRVLVGFTESAYAAAFAGG